VLQAHGHVRTTLLIAHPDDVIRMNTATSQIPRPPRTKPPQDLDDIHVLE